MANISQHIGFGKKPVYTQEETMLLVDLAAKLANGFNKQEDGQNYRLTFKKGIHTVEVLIEKPLFDDVEKRILSRLMFLF